MCFKRKVEAADNNFPTYKKSTVVTMREGLYGYLNQIMIDREHASSHDYFHETGSERLE